MKKSMLLFAFLAFLSLQIYAQNTVTGTVTDSKGQGLPGATVTVKGTTVAQMTDTDGKYSIELPTSPAVLIFSYIGLETQEIEVTSGSAQNATLVVGAEDVGDVIIVGYSTQKRGSITGSVDIMEADKLENVPVASFDNMFQGQAAGVTAISSSGRPGSAAVVRIRGIGSINAGADPLYIMDGIVITAGDFAGLNPNDIEGVRFLKDAASTAIYGSRASNGVIQIITKRGKNQKTQITVRNQFGYNSMAQDKFDMMNTQQKLDFEELIGIRTPGAYNRDSLMGINTNWKDYLIRKETLMNSHEVSARGGDAKTKFFISAGYYNQEGILPGSKFDRYSTRMNLDHNATDALSFGTSLHLSLEENDNSIEGDGYENNIYNPVFSSRLLNPYTKPYDENGEFTDAGLPWANPLEQIVLNDDYNRQIKLVGNVYAELEIIKNLKFKTVVGADFWDYTSYRWLNPKAAWGLVDGLPTGFVSRGFSRGFTMTNTNTLRYSKQVDKHYFNIIAGQESINDTYESFSFQSKGFANDKITVPDATAEIEEWGGNEGGSSFMSGFAQANYNYDDKYFVDASFRRDASSRFGESNRHANFWSSSFMWNILRESFISEGLITDLRLRASIGTTGNSEIGNYTWRSLYTYAGITYNDVPGSAPSAPGNPDLTWEKSLSSNIGIDLSLLDRIQLGVEVYNRETTKMLFDVPYSLTTGFYSGWGNVASMVNKGVDLTVALDIFKGDFVWNINTNVGYVDNEITELYGDVQELPDTGTNTTIEVGQSIGTFYAVRYAGVNPANGQPLWYDKDGNITNTFSEDDAVTLEGKSWLAPYSGGFTNTFSYKGVTLSSFLTWVKGKYLMNNTRYFTENPNLFGAYNQSTSLLEDMWMQPGDVKEIPGYQYAQEFDTHMIEDASFLRLKNVTISYNLPSKLVEKTKFISGIQVYAQGQNLWTLTPYKGYDPEYYGSVELNVYPQYKSYTFGIDIKF